MEITDRLIFDKLDIPPDQARIRRTRLLSVLAENLASCNSTVLIGRAGVGKTSLVADFARTCQRDVAWYKVDAPDADLRLFMTYLVAAIRERRPGFGKTTVAPLIENAEPEQVPLLAEAFIYELLQSNAQPLLIIIEDLHLVCDAEWLVPLFKRILPLLPADVHLLITSRTMPPAPLWRMRSKQTLAVVDENMLCFSRPEAIELFESFGLSAEQACIALDHTHGRAATLANFATTLQDSASGSPKNRERSLDLQLEP